MSNLTRTGLRMADGKTDLQEDGFVMIDEKRYTVNMNLCTLNHSDGTIVLDSRTRFEPSERLGIAPATILSRSHANEGDGLAGNSTNGTSPPGRPLGPYLPPDEYQPQPRDAIDQAHYDAAASLLDSRIETTDTLGRLLTTERLEPRVDCIAGWQLLYAARKVLGSDVDDSKQRSVGFFLKVAGNATRAQFEAQIAPRTAFRPTDSPAATDKQAIKQANRAAAIARGLVQPATRPPNTRAAG